jgi:hydrogenase maturation protein HypF
MDLEFVLRPGIDAAYDFEIDESDPVIVDWETAIHQILRDQEVGESAGVISAKFHNMLAEIIAAVAEKIGQPKVVLSGGCFQNRYLLERTVDRLLAKNFRPYWHQRVPPNDGGIALGQITVATRQLAEKGNY